jgi:hypothetical protein
VNATARRSQPAYSGRVSWWQILVAVAIGVVIWKVGTAVLRAVSASHGPDAHPDPEDVGELDVYLVCSECGTEFRVTRLGELQVPRHCGETMDVVRRPATGAPRPPE